VIEVPSAAMAVFAPCQFKIRVEDSVLDDLKYRLQHARVDKKNIENAGHDPSGSWAYGTDRGVLEQYLNHWRDRFDWRKQEDALNKLPHFMAKLHCPISRRDLDIHFIHATSSAPDAIPLLLVHGWPGSVVEFLKVIPLLNAAGFTVVAPSIPGYGWSEAPTTPGANVWYMADRLHTLMQELGYAQYAAQGGDWGGAITTRIARQYPKQCVALHVNFCFNLPFDWYSALKAVIGLPFMSRAEWAALKSTLYFLKYETAYQRIQGTKPQSLAYGLNDSPLGLLAWHLEKFQSWSDCGSSPPEASGLTIDEILTNVMVYWVTQSIGTSCRLYYESIGHHPRAAGPTALPGGYVPVPTGVLWASRELIKLPRHVAAECFNLKQWSVQEKGGHFFAFEQPEAMAADVTKFFKRTIDFEECKRRAPSKGQGPGLQPLRYLILSSIICGTALAAGKLWRSRL